MHFSKTYSQILLSLPDDLRQNSIQYRQLKKLINQVVLELSSHGLSPNILQELIIDSKGAGAHHTTDIEADDLLGALSKVVYEIEGEPDHIVPRLRLLIELPESGSTSPSELREHLAVHLGATLSEVQMQPLTSDGASITEDGVGGDGDVVDGLHTTKKDSYPSPRHYELVIPLVADGAFFELLSDALRALSEYLTGVRSDFSVTLRNLAATISSSARPMSATSSFRPYSVVSSDPSASLSPPNLFRHAKTDLYTWRCIFQLYMESEVFESTKETSRGQHTVEETERRLELFTTQLRQRGLTDRAQLKSKESRDALMSFLRMNHFILNIKKFQLANAEATRKILKKHTKRTCLPLPPLSDSSLPSAGPVERTPVPLSLSLRPQDTILAQILVQAINETLLPVIPHIDDYSCLICTSIAFKPIRLSCGHLFCVRCLVKMQKRGNGDCPMCRAPSVLVADRSNVDWAMLNFMQDWFPKETKEKIKQNETEVVEEQLAELGLDSHQGCNIM
ncbi:hypothetical protein PC9H_004172 [Pleurotus ostreatus]|uniref:RING-14 protein n=1 Tax=Pleurotus ostreatus TaxID=5322 RepID=A0A8H7DX55_PLEOS|nr:uncharacterized protein PC9H_004172 [Pleurotus ostreatus]KAF7437333.1 hypothetical protein PC9H_004172 [Pleurotus ostreatus]